MKETVIKGNLPVEYRLFGAPNFVLAKMAGVEGDGNAVPLEAVPDSTFHELVEEWVRQIYEKANKQRPPIPAR